VTIQRSEIGELDVAGALPRKPLALYQHPDVAETATARDAYDVPTWRDPTAVISAIQELEPSVRASEVFARLAARCVPAFSDDCWTTISEGDVTTTIPPSGEERPNAVGAYSAPAEGALVLGIEGGACEDWPAFTAEMTWLWYDRDRPTRSDKVIAQLLLDHAKNLTCTHRLEATVAAERAKVSNLRIALESNREIGRAVGILMWSHKITGEQGFELLRDVSQRTHRKLIDLAIDVCATGTLEVVATVPTPARPSHDDHANDDR
jgi:hypothetical protein